MVLTFELFVARFALILSRQTRCMRGRGLLAALALSLSLVVGGAAQTSAPLPLPNTFSTVAGSSNGAAGATGFTVGGACSPGSPYTATDVYGNGCLATQAVFGPDMMDGIHVDGQGNLYITDYDNNWTGTAVGMIRRVDAKSGVITMVMGNGLNNAGTTCATATNTVAGAQDGNGDGCLLSFGKTQKDRGYGMDPYGNFFTGSYSSGYVRIFCNAVSPLCPVAAGVTQTYSSAQKQVGYGYRIAGCLPSGPAAGAVSSPSGSGTPGNGGDGYLASSFWNLPGDLAAWGPSNSSFNGPSSITGTNGTCATSNPSNTGGLNGARGVTSDQYGNVFIADGSNIRIRVVVGPPSYNGVANPLPAILQLNPVYSAVTAAQMYGRIYPMVGGYPATTKNGSCPAGSVGGVTGSSLDTYGDACPWFNTSLSNANPASVTIDTTLEGGTFAANLIIADGNNSNLRVVYMGPTVAVGSVTATGYPMANTILLNNIPTAPLTQITHGYVYLLAGNGGTFLSSTTSAPVLGSAAILGIGGSRVEAGPNGNIYISAGSGTSASVLMYDLSAGTIRILLTSAGALTYSSVVSPGIGTYTSNTYCPTFGQGDGTAAFSTSGAYSAATISSGICFLAQGTGSSTQGVAVDSSNNLYLTDDEMDNKGYGRSRIRKVLASQLYPTTIGTSLTQTLRLHGPVGTTAGTTAIAAAALNASTSEVTVATPVCATAADTGATVDCLANVTFTPASPGLRTATLALTDSSLSTSSLAAMNGLSMGSALVADPTALATPVTTNIIGTATTPVPIGVAVDANGDVFTMDTFAGKFTEILNGGSVNQLPGTLPSTPTQLTLDPSGNLWAAGTGASTLTELTLGTTGTYTAGIVTIAGVAAPQAVAFDQRGNLFVADQTTASVYEVAAANISGSSLPSTSGTSQSNLGLTTIATGLNTPTSLAIDGLGNVYIGDPGASAIVRVDARTGAKTTLSSGVHPSSVAADTAGNIFYQDTTSKLIVQYPLSTITSGVAGSGSTTVLSSLTTPSGLAVTGSGNILSADKGTGKLSLVSRNALTYNFGTTTGTTFGATINNAGNLAATGYTEIDSAEFPMTSGTTNGCGAIPSTSNPLAPGAACTLTSTFVPASGSVAVSGTTSLLAATSAVGALTLQGTENFGTNPSTTATISGPTNSGIYAASGTELSYTVSIAASNSSSVSGYVNVTVDTGAAVKYNLTAGSPATVTVPVSGLIVGSHSFSAIYPSGQGNDLQSNTTSQNFTITQAPTTVAWAPSATTQQYSAAVGAAVLNATSTVSGSSTTVPGYFVYNATATAAGTSNPNLHAASYLAIGTYTLGVTFVPVDTVNYASSTGSVANYTVTKANTSAPVGVSQMLVAADGTGNYTSVQTAINALPNTGGAVYIKPGTYTGFVTVAKPGVALRGLGGDPTKVIITNEDGAFSPPFLGNQSAGNNGNIGDEGSATLVVSSGTINGFSGVGNGFYAEDMSVLNTWDTDSTNADTIAYLGGSTCTANQPPDNNLSRYNKNQLCGGQALAIWTTSDLSVINNVYFASKQDTVFAGAQGGTPKSPGRQYYFRGKITGDVDYIFGDAAAVFDYTSIYSDSHGSITTGGVTIEAQNKSVQTGSANDYLSGYIMNNDVFTTLTSGMTGMGYGRPYGTYSTYLMLNSYVDQLGNNVGWVEFTAGTNNLPTSTYGEFNTIPYTDPTPGSADLNGVIYSGTGGSTGQGVNATRETSSQAPGTPMANNAVKTVLTAGQATLYYPNAFLGTTVNTSSTGVKNWVPTAALAANVNAFVPSGSSATVAAGSSATILMRPQTPGLGAVTNGVYTIPVGTYTLTDSYTNTSNVTTSSTLATGSLDAAGEAYYISSTLGAGTHSLTWTYSGDTNFNGSSSAAPFVLAVSGLSSVTTLSEAVNPIVYGQSANVTASVSGTGATPTGTTNLTTDNASPQNTALSSGSANYVVNGLNAGSHTFNASYSGDTSYTASTSSNLGLTVTKASLTATGTCTNRIFDQPNTCGTASISGYQYTDTQATVFTGQPAIGTAAVRTAPAGTYAATPLPSSIALTSFGATDYTVNSVNTNFTVTGNAPQTILFPTLPNLAHGTSYKLAAQTSSGLAIVYTVTTGSSIANISGSTLTITGAGAITIQAATATDPTGDYALAPPVSRSFTAP